MKKYVKKDALHMEPYHPGLDMSDVKVKDEDLLKGSPKTGDMIAVANDLMPPLKWLISKEKFEQEYILAPGEEPVSEEPHVMTPIIIKESPLDTDSESHVAVKGDL